MIIIPPEVFEKWKHIITEDSQLSKLDKKLKNIIYNKQMNDIDKWHHYRENLMKYTFTNHGRKKYMKAMNKKLIKPKELEFKPLKNKIKKTINHTSDDDENMMISSSSEEDNNDFYQSAPETDDNDKLEDDDIDDDENDLKKDDIYRKKALDGENKDVTIQDELGWDHSGKHYKFRLSNGFIVAINRKNRKKIILRSPSRLRSYDKTKTKILNKDQRSRKSQSLSPKNEKYSENRSDKSSFRGLKNALWEMYK